jgi:hypothetical protein
MYFVHWSSFCCDTGSFRGVTECDSLVEALAVYATRIDPAGSDGHASAGILRADGSQVKAKELPFPEHMAHRMLEKMAEHVRLGQLGSLEEEARLLADAAAFVMETNIERERKFDALAERAVKAMYV